MQDYTPDPFKNYKPRQNPPQVTKGKKPDLLPSSPITERELANLAGMSHDHLISLVMRMSAQCGLVASLTDDETAQAMLDTLANTALRPIAPGISLKADIQARMIAIDKWLDRKQGKAKQSIEVTEKNPYDNISTPDLLRLITDCQRTINGTFTRVAESEGNAQAGIIPALR